MQVDADSLPEPGSAHWHVQLINKAMDREAVKFGSRGSQRQFSAQSSRGSITPRQVSSREGLRKGYALTNLQTAAKLLDHAVAAQEGKVYPHTARAAMQSLEPHTPRDTSSRWPRTTGKHRPRTTANPREARIRQWQSLELESRENSRDSMRVLTSDEGATDALRPTTQVTFEGQSRLYKIGQLVQLVLAFENCRTLKRTLAVTRNRVAFVRYRPTSEGKCKIRL